MDRAKIIQAAQMTLGRPYEFGAKWDVSDFDPMGPVDCSGYVRWCYAYGGTFIPDGSWHQFACTAPLGEDEKPQAGDLGFFLKADGVPHHVGLYEGDGINVLEARGKPYNRVLRRPVKAWEAYSEFSGWRRFVAVPKSNKKK